MSSNLRVDGKITFWRLPSHFDRDVLYERLKKLGWKQHCPLKRSNSSALKEALQHIVRSWQLEDVWVRDLDNVDEDGYVVKREYKGSEDNEYETWFRSRWEQPSENVEPVAITVDGQYAADHKAINDWFQHFRRRIVSAAVSKMISVIIQEQLGGVSLKPSGGFYWIPKTSFAQYEALIAAVQASADGDCKIYSPQFDLSDESAVEAVRDAIIDDIKQRASEITTRATSKGVKQNALANRQKDANALHTRVKQYEAYLGETLTECQQVAKECEKTVVSTALQQFPDFFGLEKASEQAAAPVIPPTEITAESVNPFSVT